MDEFQREEFRVTRDVLKFVVPPPPTLLSPLPPAPRIRTVSRALKLLCQPRQTFASTRFHIHGIRPEEIITTRWLHDGCDTHHGLLKVVKFYYAYFHRGGYFIFWVKPTLFTFLRILET